MSLLSGISRRDFGAHPEEISGCAQICAPLLCVGPTYCQLTSVAPGDGALTVCFDAHLARKPFHTFRDVLWREKSAWMLEV
ncbi:hypothetical protein FIC94_20325 [Ochrobactrum teleogrylli]|uniref:Uncharacterized protein n=1 Tax=Ochrobactrum teleogrylli TaxID=2479765 RepID=A0ABY2Y1N0_9HYPH|nr:hypothetical protein FIC94_20325 [[Ochrobactrum] teleogrylli]